MAQVSNERVLNEELRHFVYEFVPEKLNSNEAFVKVFGKNFAAKKIRDSILSVYTNEPQMGKTYAGYHYGVDKSITLLRSGKDGALLSVDDVSNDTDLQEILVHEAVHAILNRTNKECRKYGIEDGTGIMQSQLDPVYYYRSEIGRGLNEGLTEWFCEKAGFKTLAYPELTNYIRLLEKFVGTEKVMELGKGDVFGRFPKILGISKDEVVSLLTLADDLYVRNSNLSKMRLVSHALDSHIRPSDYLDEETIKKQEEEFETFKSAYERDRKTDDYKDFITKKNLPDSLETLAKYYDEQIIKPMEKGKTASILNFESVALQTFFGKETEQIFNEDPVSEQSYKKLVEVYKVLNTDIKYLDDEFLDINPPPFVISFMQKFQEKQKGFSTYMAAVQTEKLKDGTFTLADFAETEKIVKLGDKNSYDRKFLTDFANSVNPGFKNEITEVMTIATDAYNSSESKALLDMLSSVRLLKVKSKDPNLQISSSIIYGKDNIFNRYNYSDQKIGKDSKEDVELDFTAGMNNEIEVATNNLEAFRKKLFIEKPDARIHISSRNIVVENGNDLSFYTIHDGKMVPMEVTEEFDMEYKIGEQIKQPTDLQLYSNKKPSALSNFINGIKKGINNFINRNKEGNINYKKSLEEQTIEGSSENASGSTVEVANMKVDSIQNEREDDFIPKVGPIKLTIEQSNEPKNQDDLVQDNDVDR